jgi:2,5-diketo-D-gluconate reductase B
MIINETKGARIPALGFGTWQLRGAACERAVRAALEIGYRHLDTAQIYGNEAEVGRAIRASGVGREAIFLTTKVWTSNLGYGAAKRSAEGSLRALGVDHVDLLLIHWPNPGIPVGETLRAFVELRDAGKTRHIGVSNFSVAEMREAIEAEGADLLCNQIEYHPLDQPRDLVDDARARGLMITAYSPLARGRVAWHPVLARIGARYGKTASQVALRWLVEQPLVSAIPKAASAEHARANFDIFDFALGPEDRAAIDALAT